jgi:hypothetical protein
LGIEMNERIQELELEAIAYADSKVPANARYNDIYHSIVRGKFAELIVQECIDVVCAERQRQLGEFYLGQQQDVGTFQGLTGAFFTVKRIKQHLGIEE